MKKIFIWTACLMLTWPLTACGDKADTQTDAEDILLQENESLEVSSQAETTFGIADDLSEDAQTGSILVAYYAYSENMGDTSGMSVDAITSASLKRDTDNTEGNLQVMAQIINEKKGLMFSRFLCRSRLILTIPQCLVGQ